MHSVHATSDVVEAVTVCICGSSRDAAACIGIVGITIRVLEDRARLGTSGVNCTACCCMESDCVGTGDVNTFDHIDFSTVWPVWPEEPERGPDATDAAWHVSDIRDKDTVRVALVARDSHRSAAC